METQGGEVDLGNCGKSGSAHGLLIDLMTGESGWPVCGLGTWCASLLRLRAGAFGRTALSLSPCSLPLEAAPSLVV